MSKVKIPMQTGFRRVGAASCQVRECVALPGHMRQQTREIVAVRTAPEHRMRGYATTLIHQLCREADSVGMILILFPQPYVMDDGEMGMGDQSLIHWYQDCFGFQPIQTDPVLLARMPGATPRMSLKLQPVTAAVIEVARHG